MARLTDDDVAAMRTSLLTWFDRHARSIQFRRQTSPYGVLVAEVMAQQTQVRRVDPAWREFMRRFPNVESLAAASTADVLRTWSGLGYNRRAVNLQRAALAITTRYGGRVPSDPETLETLPGVGAYTARAVAAVAFGVPVGAVDTNVRRVLGRLQSPTRGHAGGRPPARDLHELADRLVDPRRPADWTYALMDLGATVCRAREVHCTVCPVRRWCRSVGRSTLAERSESAASTRPRSMVNPRPMRSPPGTRRAAPFRSTSRWLRGRIVAQLAQAAPAAWHKVVVLDPETHAAVAGERLEAALSALAVERLIERDGPRRARLATTAAAIPR